MHLLDLWQEPSFQKFVVFVGHNNITNSIEAFCSESFAVKIEVSNVHRGKTFDEILLNSACGRDNAVNHFMLAQVLNILSHPAGNHIACITKEDLAAIVGAHLGIFEFILFVFVDRVIRKTKSDHFVYLLNCLPKGCGLESGVHVGLEDLVVV